MLDDFAAWWKKPYNDNMTAKQWFLFIGFMVIVSWLWTRILKTIAENID